MMVAIVLLYFFRMVSAYLRSKEAGAGMRWVGSAVEQTHWQLAGRATNHSASSKPAPSNCALVKEAGQHSLQRIVRHQQQRDLRRGQGWSVPLSQVEPTAGRCREPPGTMNSTSVARTCSHAGRAQATEN